MNAKEAAAMLAAVMTQIEAAGVVVQTTTVTVSDQSGCEITVGCGWGDGDPWVSFLPGQTITPNGIK